ncbi:MAG: hypothetical protein K2F63_02420 [Muribaculaceae bacterium]|nr:hypothetical protein [Muribaculaceae bacterium]
MELKFEDIIRDKAPGLEVMLVEADVDNCATTDRLWSAIMAECSRLSREFPMDRIRHRGAIAATREAYKACGKEPNRYRPSAEALCRRAVKGMELYRSLSVIDLINLVSMASGHSIGGFDADKIAGDTLTMGVGLPGEPYEAIGRGDLNIEGLPVWRDAEGGIGTPTSDNVRTCLEVSSQRVVMTVNMFGHGEMDRDATESLIRSLLEEHASARNIRVKYFQP